MTIQQYIPLRNHSSLLVVYINRNLNQEYSELVSGYIPRPVVLHKCAGRTTCPISLCFLAFTPYLTRFPTARPNILNIQLYRGELFFAAVKTRQDTRLILKQVKSERVMLVKLP